MGILLPGAPAWCRVVEGVLLRWISKVEVDRRQILEDPLE
jgi:hypothetical protein